MEGREERRLMNAYLLHATPFYDLHPMLIVNCQSLINQPTGHNLIAETNWSCPFPS